MSKEKKVHRSDYIIEIDGSVTIVKDENQARKKFRNSINKETYNNCYLYRRDYDSKDRLIETYMLAWKIIFMFFLEIENSFLHL